MKTDKLAKKQVAHLEKLIANRDGQAIREIVDRVAKAYENNKHDLFMEISDTDNHPLLTGIASSAYYKYASNFSILNSHQFGGLGATIVDSSKRFQVGRNQLWFAEIKGEGLVRTSFQGNSGWFATFKDNSGHGLNALDESLWFATFKDKSARYAEFFNDSGANTEFLDNSGSGAMSRNNSLAFAIAKNNSLNSANNHDYSLMGANIFDLALRYSSNYDFALAKANLYDLALAESKHTNGNTLKDAIYHSETVLAQAKGVLNPTVIKNLEENKGEELDGLVLEAVGQIFGFTRENVRRIQHEAFKKVRKRLIKAIQSTNLSKEITKEDVAQSIRDQLYQGSFAKQDLILGGAAKEHVKLDELLWTTNYSAYSTDTRLQTNTLGYSSERSNLVAWRDSGYTTRVIWGKRHGLLQEDD